MIGFQHHALDSAIVFFFNKFCGKSVFLDTLALIFLSVDALRTAILVALVVGIWEYGKIKNDISANKRVLMILFSVVLTLGAIEILNALIDSPRPVVTHEKLINSPIITPDTKPLWKDGWVRNPKHGSFPSDTVALLSTIAIGLFFWNKTLGAFAILFVFFVGILPRLYFGLHYPSDMAIGFIISLLSSWFVEKVNIFNSLSKRILSFQNRYPYIFGTAGFYLAYVIADKFILLRKLPVWIKVMLSK
ncbi:MAG: phosphatase PAP2 family protein [Candidatus Melainabacteria bacterium]|nr:phosphatase PAP2 family protein [Candidatus Melainabacteria bacterium]